MSFFDEIFSVSFLPHGHCYLWKPGLVWLHVISDSLITLAYYSIPAMLVYFVTKKRDVPFHWIFLMFGAFILACGTTHAMEVWTLWYPAYWISGLVKAFTAMISVATALVLFPLIPRALQLRTPAELEAANLALQEEIAERRRAEAELAEHAEELARSNADLEQFAYVASHDLQEPLRMVASYTQLLSRRYQGRLDADADEFIRYTVDGVARMQELILDLLAYSRVARQEKQLETVELETVLDEVTSNLRKAIEEGRAEIVHDRLPAVLGDRAQLTQLLQNLVGNAIKFRGKADPRVEVKCASEGEAWHLSVVDNGIGIDPAYFDRIFVIFQRLHTRDRYPGSGIGLAICKKIVERHDGRIWVDSSAAGSAFHFTLPRGPA